ncbi:hypothetical protein CMUS01_05545 [Colletotrichum musicola]|uniref:Uncharacterized protein n=1 Tax=Colletotrichum musicola TaxID=2175873 RepID=A0A8H6NKL4_9PEZI|nr:hypothetical protein CMUS01_05545 [Colletotrichum musicola]
MARALGGRWSDGRRRVVEARERKKDGHTWDRMGGDAVNIIITTLEQKLGSGALVPLRRGSGGPLSPKELLLGKHGEVQPSNSPNYYGKAQKRQHAAGCWAAVTTAVRLSIDNPWIARSGLEAAFEHDQRTTTRNGSMYTVLGPALSGGETDGEREVGGTETGVAARAIPRAPNRGVRGLQVSAVAAVGVGARWWLPSSQYPYPGQAQPHWTWALN